MVKHFGAESDDHANAHAHGHTSMMWVCDGNDMVIVMNMVMGVLGGDHHLHVFVMGYGLCHGSTYKSKASQTRLCYEESNTMNNTTVIDILIEILMPRCNRLWPQHHKVAFYARKNQSNSDQKRSTSLACMYQSHKLSRTNSMPRHIHLY